MSDATPSQVDAAIAINEEVRLRALKAGLLIFAGVSLLAVVPASRLPRYRPHELEAPSPAAERPARSPAVAARPGEGKPR